MQANFPQSKCAICYDDSAQYTRASTLANALSLPCIDSNTNNIANYDYVLSYQADRLTLQCLRQSKLKPFYVDFCQGKLHYRLQYDNRRRQPLARAVGIKSGVRPSVLDLTAGFGQDASVLANLGCFVTLIERHPVIFALLDDGLKRARAANCNWCEHVVLIHRDANTYCQALLNQQTIALPDVIYCDPMFPEKNSRALVQKPMQILQALAGKDDTSDALFTLACQIAQNRLVVKRPKTAAPWCDKVPNSVINMAKHRFDVYWTRANS